jgi:hypothetical protein
MLRWGFIIQLLLGSVVLSATFSAQTSSIEGNVTSADGRPLKDAEIRFEQKVRKSHRSNAKRNFIPGLAQLPR